MIQHGNLKHHELAALVDGSLPPVRAHEVSQHAQRCVSCRTHMDELQAVVGILQADDGDLEHLELASPRASTSRARRYTQTRISSWLAAASAAAALVSIGLVVQHHDRLDYRPRAGAIAETARWTGIHVFRMDGGATPTPVGKTIARDDALVFSYINASDTPFTYLMILGVDAAGVVEWYYPAYLDSREDPLSISTEPAQRTVVLPERLRHRLAPGPLTLRAIFSRQPLRVKDIEAKFPVTMLRSAEPLQIPGVETLQQTLELDVE